MTIQEAAEQFAQGIKSDKSAVLQVADEFATITRYKKYATHYESLKRAAGYEWVKVDGDDDKIADEMADKMWPIDEFHETDAPFKEAIKQAIAIGRQQGKWISVEDRLPEYGEKVLVRGEQKGMNPQMGGAYTFISERKNLKGTSLEKQIDRLLDENHFHANYVTHWQPLPSPPKTEQP